MPSTIGSNANKHFPKDFFDIGPKDKAQSSIHCARNQLASDFDVSPPLNLDQSGNMSAQLNHNLDPSDQSCMRSTFVHSNVVLDNIRIPSI